MSHRLPAALRHLAHRVWSWHIRQSTSRADRRRILGLDLVIFPGVLHPGHFLSSRLLARYIQTLPLAGLRVADLGTGSGFLGLIAAERGATVTAVDINPQAVACAEANVARNHLAERMTVRLSDVFDALAPDERFDLVVTNPPFYPRPAVGAADHAFAAGPEHAFMRRLAATLNERLRPGGELVMIHSSDTSFGPIEALMQAQGLTARTVAIRRGLFETLTIRVLSASRTTR